MYGNQPQVIQGAFQGNNQGVPNVGIFQGQNQGIPQIQNQGIQHAQPQEISQIQSQGIPANAVPGYTTSSTPSECQQVPTTGTCTKGNHRFNKWFSLRFYIFFNPRFIQPMQQQVQQMVQPSSDNYRCINMQCSNLAHSICSAATSYATCRSAYWCNNNHYSNMLYNNQYNRQFSNLCSNLQCNHQCIATQMYNNQCGAATCAATNGATSSCATNHSATISDAAASSTSGPVTTACSAILCNWPPVSTTYATFCANDTNFEPGNAR